MGREPDGGEKIVVLATLKPLAPVILIVHGAPCPQVQQARRIRSAHVCRGARPRVLPRAAEHPRAHGVAFNVNERVAQVGLVEHARLESVLPQGVPSAAAAELRPCMRFTY